MYAFNWIMGRSLWPAWVFFLGTAVQVVAVFLLEEHFGYSYYEEFFIYMPVVFLVLYIAQNFWNLWNRFIASQTNQ